MGFSQRCFWLIVSDTGLNALRFGSYKRGPGFFQPLRALQRSSNPEGPTYTTIMELGPKNQNRDGFSGA